MAPSLVIDGLLMYVTSCISCDTPQDIQNVVYDTYNDETVTTAKALLWEHYDEAVDLGRNTARRTKNKHVEDIIGGIRKVDEHYSDKTELPVIFVASDIRTLPAKQSKTANPDVDVKFESRVKALEDQMALVLMDDRRADHSQTVSSQPQQYSSAVTRNMQQDISQNGSGLRGPSTSSAGRNSDVTIVSRDGTEINTTSNSNSSDGVITERPENWTLVTHARRHQKRPKPVYGRGKADENLTALPRRYTIVVFNVSNKQEDNVKNYMSANNVDILDIKWLSGEDHFVHSFKVVIYRKLAETVLEDNFWPEEYHLYLREKL